MEKVTGEVIKMNIYKSYQDYKAAVDSELQRSAEGFVKIGYLLKLARDTDILSGSGYATVTEFAEGEYNLDKTQVSRFTNINDQFSISGYSAELDSQYKGFGYAKLALMLRLPTVLNEEISPTFSKAEILEIKEEVDAERAVSDIEVMLEGEPQAREHESNMSKALYQLLHDQPDFFKEIWEIGTKPELAAQVKQKILDTLAPQGEAIHSVRVKGIGRLMICIKGLENDIKLINVRTEEKEVYGWGDIVMMLWEISDATCRTARECWEKTFGEKYPESEPQKPSKTEVAPVQPRQEEKKPVQRKQSKVTKAKTPEPEPQKEEPPLLGQKEIYDYPEVIPADMETPPVSEGQPAADVENAPETHPVEITENGENTQYEKTFRPEEESVAEEKKEVRHIITSETPRDEITEIMLEMERVLKLPDGVIIVTIRTGKW